MAAEAAAEYGSSPEALAIYAGRREPHIRASIIANPRATMTLVKLLAKDQDSSVRKEPGKHCRSAAQAGNSSRGADGSSSMQAPTSGS